MVAPLHQTTISTYATPPIIAGYNIAEPVAELYKFLSTVAVTPKFTNNYKLSCTKTPPLIKRDSEN